MRRVERFVLLQFAEEVGAQAHHRAQPPVAETDRDEFRKAAALPLLGAQVKLFALVDVEQKGRRGRLLDVVAITRFGCIEEIAQA